MGEIIDAIPVRIAFLHPWGRVTEADSGRAFAFFPIEFELSQLAQPRMPVCSVDGLHLDDEDAFLVLCRRAVLQKRAQLFLTPLSSDSWAIERERGYDLPGQIP